MELLKLYRAGQKTLEADKRKEAESKQGCLRAGSTGCVVSSGVIGCPRKALIRKFNLDMPIDMSTMLMFEGGLANEEAWTKVLSAALPAGSVVKREEEIPIEWTTSNGTRVTGRPDIVVGKESDNGFIPELGIELKEISSLWTIRSVVFDGQPKTANLMQAAHYMMALGIPYKLVYTSRNIFAVDGGGWMGKIFPKVGTPGSEFCEYNEKGNLKNIRPLMKVYDLQFSPDNDRSPGVLHFKDEVGTEWKPTIITKDGIKEYFESVSKMEADNDIGPRPAQLDALGNKESYSACQYCDLRPMCDTYESDLRTWLKHVTKIYGNR